MAKLKYEYVDPYDAIGLARFAARSQVLSHFGSLGALAEHRGLKDERGFNDASAISRKLGDKFDRDCVVQLDNVLQAKTHSEIHLTTLYDDIVERGANLNYGVNVSPSFFDALTRTGPARSTGEALIRGHALVQYLRLTGLLLDNELDLGEKLVRSFPKSGFPADFLSSDQFDRAKEVIDDLLIVAGFHSSLGAQPARNLVSSLGISLYTLRRIRFHIENGNPLWWRLVRVITTVVAHTRAELDELNAIFNRTDEEADRKLRAQQVMAEAFKLVLWIDTTNPPCAHRHRALLEEAMGRFPKGGEPDYDTKYDELTRRLMRRAKDGRSGDGSDRLLPPRARVVAGWTAFWRLRRLAECDLTKELKGMIECMTASDVAAIKTGGLQLAVAYTNADKATQLNERVPSFDNFVATNLWHTHDGSHHVPAILEKNPAHTMATKQLHDHFRPIRQGHLAESYTALESLLTFVLTAPDGVGRRNILNAIANSGPHTERAATDALNLVYRTAVNSSPQNEMLLEVVLFALGWIKHRNAIDTLLDGAQHASPDIACTALIVLSDLVDSLRNINETKRREIAEIARSRTADPSLRIRRSATYVLTMLMNPEDTTATEILEITVANYAKGNTDDQLTASLAQFGLDRIRNREALATAKHTPDPMSERLYRRIVDPIGSAKTVAKMRSGFRARIKTK